MTTFLSLLLISTFTLDYFAIKLAVLNRGVTLLPEVFSLAILLIVIARYIVLRRWEQPVSYLGFFIGLMLICLIGAMAEAVDPGPLTFGLRNYFKFLPLFFLPAVYRFTDKQLRVVIGTFLIMAALQVPLAFFQRFIHFADAMHTGDVITGSVTVSSSLTMVLCFALAFIITMYIHGRISLPMTLALFCFVAAPTTINETKATVVLLPLAVLGPFIVARGVEKKWRKSLPILGLCVFALIAFGAVYNTMIENRWGGTGVGDFFSGSKATDYLYRGTIESGEDLQGDLHIGRFDSMALPVNYMSGNWMQVFFGLGIGNVSSAPLPELEGAYLEVGKELGFGLTAVGNLIWETGLVGMFMYLFVFFVIWRDTRRAAALEGAANYNWYYTWWTICVVIFIFGFVYKSVLQLNELGYFVFFFSGVTASRYWHLRNPGAAALESKDQAKPRLKLAGQQPSMRFESAPD